MKEKLNVQNESKKERVSRFSEMLSQKEQRMISALRRSAAYQSGSLTSGSAATLLQLAGSLKEAALRQDLHIESKDLARFMTQVYSPLLSAVNEQEALLGELEEVLAASVSDLVSVYKDLQVINEVFHAQPFKQ